MSAARIGFTVVALGTFTSKGRTSSATTQTNSNLFDVSGATADGVTGPCA